MPKKSEEDDNGDGNPKQPKQDGATHCGSPFVTRARLVVVELRTPDNSSSSQFSLSEFSPENLIAAIDRLLRPELLQPLSASQPLR